MFERCRPVLLGYKSLNQMVKEYPKPCTVNAYSQVDDDAVHLDVQSHLEEVMGWGAIDIPGYGMQVCGVSIG
jgi:hypothetical protein